MSTRRLLVSKKCSNTVPTECAQNARLFDRPQITEEIVTELVDIELSCRWVLVGWDPSIRLLNRTLREKILML